MDNLFENKVILTDEEYKSVRSDLAIWYICLVVKLALIALLILWFTHLEWILFPEKWFVSIVPFNNITSYCLIFLGLIIVPYVLLVAISMVHDLQTTAQNSLDTDFLGFGKDAWHILEIFPGKSMRLAHREVRRYRRQKRLQKKERKEKQNE